MSPNCDHQRAYILYPRWYMSMELWWNYTDRGKPEEFGERPIPVRLCPPQISYGLTRARTRASAVRGQRLTAWAMARLQYSITSFLCFETVLKNRLGRKCAWRFCTQNLFSLKLQCKDEAGMNSHPCRGVSGGNNNSSHGDNAFTLLQ
jgi:hypothetical protein